MTKKRIAKYDYKNGFGYLFIAAALAALVAIWVFINKVKIGASSPDFIFPGIISGYLCMFFFITMLYSAAAIFKRLNFPKPALILAVIVSLLTVVVAINAVYVDQAVGYLYN